MRRLAGASAILVALAVAALFAQTLTLDTTLTKTNLGSQTTKNGVLVEERRNTNLGETIYRLLRMPSVDGMANQYLKTDGAGNLGWASVVSTFAWSAITSGTPTTLAGYGISDSITAATAASTYAPKPLTGTTGSIGGGTLTASCATGTATVATSTTSMVAIASPNADITDAAYSIVAWVSTNGTVTVAVCGTGTPTATTYNVRVIQ